MKTLTLIILLTGLFACAVFPQTDTTINCNTSDVTVDSSPVMLAAFPGYILYIMCLVGWVLHLFTEKKDASTRGLTYDLAEHIRMGIITLIAAVVVIFCYDYLPEYIRNIVGILNPFTAFMLGYFSDSLLKSITTFTGSKQ